MNQFAVHPQYFQLQEGSHAVEELRGILLPYIERDIGQWTESQRDAYGHLLCFLDHPVAQDTLQSQLVREPALAQSLIFRIGELFLLGKLEGIQFQYRFDQADAAQTQVSGLAKNGNIVSAHINAAHSLFRGLNHQQWRHTFLNQLLRVAIQAFFLRFDHLPADYGGTQAHSAYSIVAEAVERRASQIFGVRFNLDRFNAFVTEVQARNKVDYSQYELNRCFGNRFAYNPTTKVLYVQGARILPASILVGPRSMNAIRETHIPLLGPARYPMESAGTLVLGTDVLIVDLQI